MLYIIGTPSELSWPGVGSLPNYIEFQPSYTKFPIYDVNIHKPLSIEQFIQSNYHQTAVASLFQAYAPADSLYVFITLIISCLELNPLKHAYFMMQPPMTTNDKLSLPYSVLKSANGFEMNSNDLVMDQEMIEVDSHIRVKKARM